MPRAALCRAPGCTEPKVRMRLCAHHLEGIPPAARAGLRGREKKADVRCIGPDCDGWALAGYAYCVGHVLQVMRGRRLRPVAKRDGNYRFVTVNGKMVPEHRWVMETMLKRPLIEGENVHHKNGVRDDNRESNLELWVVYQPAGQRPEDLVAWAKDILARYAA